jgi:serine/threonine-protein kinase
MPDDVAALVMRCLERSIDRRPESATDVANVLAEIALRPETPDTAATLVAETAPGSYQGSRGSSVSTERASSSAARSSEQGTLAVLPFHHRGPAEHAHLAEVIAEDLVDVLTRTRGLRVTSSRATAKYLGQSVDPRSAGRELAVEAIVDGSVRILGDRVRISARLIDVATGEQLWTDRFDGLLAEAREIEEITPQRMAERLRQELELLGARHAVPLEAVDLYLEANRRIATAGWTGTDAAPTTLADGQVVDLLDRAIAIAPDFGLALAAHADFSVRRWFMPAGQNEETAKKAHESVARASVRAPQVPLTHYAAGRLAVSDGRFGDAARELTLALALAPTYAGVHAYLGSLQCEAGRGDEGERHIRLASRLDPALAVGTMLARHVAFDRDLARFRETIEELRAKQVESRFVLDLIEMRVGGWFGDLETVRRCRPSSHIQEHAANRVLDAQRAALLGESSEAQLLATLENALVPGSGPRLVAALRQLVVEGLAPMGAVESAMAQLRLLTDSPAFVDADWLERCPALDPLRSQADFITIVARVRLRADAIWRVASST